MENRRIFEYCLVAGVLGLGIPVSALLGARDGEKAAALAYPLGKSGQAGAPPIRDYGNILVASEPGVARGKDLFLANCVACHGADADGQGPAAKALNPIPRNFLDAGAKWTRGRGPLDIYATVTGGIPGTGMPGFSASLSVEDRWAVVHYLGSLPGVKGQFQPLDPAAAAGWKP